MTIEHKDKDKLNANKDFGDIEWTFNEVFGLNSGSLHLHVTTRTHGDGDGFRYIIDSESVRKAREAHAALVEKYWAPGAPWDWLEPSYCLSTGRWMLSITPDLGGASFSMEYCHPNRRGDVLANYRTHCSGISTSTRKAYDELCAAFYDLTLHTPEEFAARALANSASKKACVSRPIVTCMQ